VRNHLALSFGQKSISFPSFECTPWESNMLQGTYFILVESMPDKYIKAVFLILWTVFGIGYVAYMSSTRCRVSCWQQQLECEWNAKCQNCEADAQRTEPAGFLQCFSRTECIFSVRL